MQRRWIVAGVLALSLASGRVAGAQVPAPRASAEAAPRDTLTLSLADAQRLALRESPAYLAERKALDVALGEVRQARVYNFNPELELEAPGAGSEGAVGPYEARLTQEIEWAGQRGLRIRAARVGLNRTESTVRDAARITLARASEAYYAVLAANRRLELTREVLVLSERLLSATRTQLREGEISVLEANLAEIEYGRARARVLAAEREAASALLALKHATGLPPERPLQLKGEVPDAPSPAALAEDSLIALALARRPDLAARTAAVTEYQTLRRLAAREALPNLTVGALTEGESLDGSPRIGMSVGVSLPVFDRNQGVRAQREAQAEQAVLEAAAVGLAIRTEVADALRTYRAATEESAVLENSVLEPARQNQGLLETAYQAGKVGLPELLLLRNQLLDAELSYWDAWLARREALVALQAATATLADESSPEGNDDE